MSKDLQYFVMDEFNSEFHTFDSKEEALKHADDAIGDGGEGWEQEILARASKSGGERREQIERLEKQLEMAKAHLSQAIERCPCPLGCWQCRTPRRVLNDIAALEKEGGA